MNRILVLITLADNGIEQIKANPELPKKEMEFVRQWKEEGFWRVFLFPPQKRTLS